MRQTPEMPQSRELPLDIEDPQFDDLFDLSFLRVLDAAKPNRNSPPRLFPTSETFFGNEFSVKDSLYGSRPELEFSRMRFTLSQLQERTIPASMVQIVHLITSSEDTLKAWRCRLPHLRVQITREIGSLINSAKIRGVPTQHKDAYVAIPKDYKTHLSGSRLALKLWRLSLAQMIENLRIGKTRYVREFLEVYAFLKDPLGGLERPFDKGALIFVQLMAFVRQFARKGRDDARNPHFWKYAVAQAAHESLFLADPLMQSVSYIHFSHHHQLCYADVKLDEMPRSEFSIATHVVRVIEEILTAPQQSDGGRCAVPPITVATYPALARQNRENMTIIIDGNHRATATMILRFLAEYPKALTQDDSSLSEFCTLHGLETKWKIDLAEVLRTLRHSSCVKLLQQNWHTVHRFRHIDTVPALVVQEADFHTACQQRPPVSEGRRPHALLPVHQALFNDSELGLAFPQAGQVHGRTPGFKAMALLPAGTATK